KSAMSLTIGAECAIQSVLACCFLAQRLSRSPDECGVGKGFGRYTEFCHRGTGWQKSNLRPSDRLCARAIDEVLARQVPQEVVGCFCSWSPSVRLPPMRIRIEGFLSATPHASTSMRSTRKPGEPSPHLRVPLLLLAAAIAPAFGERRLEQESHVELRLC